MARLGTSSVVYEIALFRAGEETAAAEGRFVHVWVERATGRPSAVPEKIRRALTPILASRPMTSARSGGIATGCARMSAMSRDDARAILGAFLGGDAHYLASAGRYGDGGMRALDAALDLFLARPELGFVWLAYAGDGDRREAAGACVVCYAISTARGASSPSSTMSASTHDGSGRASAGRCCARWRNTFVRKA